MRARAAAIATCAMAVVIGGCGGSGHPAASATTSATTNTSRSGLAGEPAARILASAEAALDRVHSFHLQAVTTSGAPTTVSADFALPGRAAIVINIGPDTIAVRVIAGTVYFRANRGYFAAEAAAAHVPAAGLIKLANRWVSASPSQVPTVASFIALTNPADLGRCLLGANKGTVTVGGETSVGGRRAVELLFAGDRPGGAPGGLYVAASGPPLPLRLTATGPTRPGAKPDLACGETSASTAAASTSNDFITRVNVPIAISVPPGAVSLSSLTSQSAATTGVAAAPVKIAHTKLGAVAYRTVGSGTPLVLIMGYAGTMQTWDPRFVDALAKRYRVVIFDNAGIDGTQGLAAPLTIDAMADQTSALIDTLGLGSSDVLGWSMGGMIAQALAVRHPEQVRRLVLCATFAGNGKVARPSQSAIDALTNGNQRQAALDLFPADQAPQAAAFAAALATYPSAPAAPAATITAQAHAVTQWWDGRDPAGEQTAKITSPTLVADGAVDQLDPVSNDYSLVQLVPGAKIMIYADAGHAFLFQDEAAFVPVLESFLG